MSNNIRINFKIDTNTKNLLQAWMRRLQDKYKKSDAIVGIEPTGHYWFDLGAYLEDEGILLVMVNPYAVKQTKELDDNSQKVLKDKVESVI